MLSGSTTQQKTDSIKNNPTIQNLERWYDFSTDRFRPSSGFHADLVDDSLEDQDASLGAVCTGGEHNCCLETNPCKEGAGDCYTFEHTACTGDLLCGKHNCDFGNPAYNFTEADDCCYWAGETFCIAVSIV